MQINKLNKHQITTNQTLIKFYNSYKKNKQRLIKNKFFRLFSKYIRLISEHKFLFYKHAML
jgi:hypothetical protein